MKEVKREEGKEKLPGAGGGAGGVLCASFSYEGCVTRSSWQTGTHSPSRVACMETFLARIVPGESPALASTFSRQVGGLAERICSTVTNVDICVKNKFYLPNTLGAPRTQEYRFSLSAGCIHYSFELHTASLVFIQNFY